VSEVTIMRFSILISLAFFSVALGCGDTTPSTTTAGTGGSGTGGSGGSSTGSSSTGGSTGGSSTGGSSAGGSSTGGSSTGGSSTGGSSTGGSSTGGSGGSGPCMPKTTDASKIGTDCAASMMCPKGYECWEFDGFAVQYYCAILCEDTCECPEVTTCTMMSDKGKIWKECVPQ
jgi:hypothetical protein